MAKFAEAERRIFHNVFVCRACKTKLRAPNLKVSLGKIKCRKCNSRALRPIKKK